MISCLVKVDYFARFCNELLFCKCTINKQETHEPHCSPENKHFCAYITRHVHGSEKRLYNILLLRIQIALLQKLVSLLPKEALCQVWMKLAQWFWRRSFLNFVNKFLLFVIMSFWKKAWPLHLDKPESPSSYDVSCQVWLKLAQWFWRRFLNFVVRWAKMAACHNLI